MKHVLGGKKDVPECAEQCQTSTSCTELQERLRHCLLINASHLRPEGAWARAGAEKGLPRLSGAGPNPGATPA